jgi:Ca2+-transporting ATPase
VATAHAQPHRWVGLSQAEAAARLAAEGPNQLPQEERRTLLRVLLEVVREPMFVLLLASAGLYLGFGDWREGLTLLAFVVVVIAITVIQEGRTEKALDALRDLSSPRAQVLRDGHVITLPGKDLVRGDIIRVAEGDRVPADAALREGQTLSVDESLLTGESVPASKQPDEVSDRLAAPGGDGTASLFSGTLVVGGRGVAEVLATGARSELGKIGASLKEVERDRTPLQREVDLIVRRMAIVGLALSAMLVAGRGLLEHDWLAAALSGITLAMALLPEEFPVVLTVFLALGARRIARSRVLTRRVTSVETLGAAQVLCTDKTGTLTQNKMTIRRLWTPDEVFEIPSEPPATLPEAVHALVEFGLLGCPRDPFDPMEKAFWVLGRRTLSQTEHVHPKWEAVREYPLSPQLLAVTHAWRDTDEGGLVIATTGAPEAIFDLCHLESEALEVWRTRVTAMARDGLRVLGVARGDTRPEESPEHPHDVPFALLGLVGLEDPLRTDVADAVTLCERARIRVIMITGDHPDTALAIARQAGFGGARVLLGPDIEKMSDETLAEELTHTWVVARAVPEHKLRIVRALKSRGLVVGMTGDGVNDAPALKAADIGIAMGARGTDVAREASSLVLVNDDFGSIVEAVRIGRRIYDNLRNAVGYIVAVHLPIAGLSIAPVLFGWGAILTPIHVVFLELIIDPVCSIVFEMEPEEPGLMNRPPRSRTDRLFSLKRVMWSVAQGTLALAATLVLISQLRSSAASEVTQRTLGFIALVTSNLGLLLTTRSGVLPFWKTVARSNVAVPIVLGVALSTLLLMTFIRPLGGLFGFGDVSIAGVLQAFGYGFLPVLALDLLKPVVARRASLDS